MYGNATNIEIVDDNPTINDDVHDDAMIDDMHDAVQDDSREDVQGSAEEDNNMVADDDEEIEHSNTSDSGIDLFVSMPIGNIDLEVDSLARADLIEDEIDHSL